MAKLRLLFSKREQASYISHLDLMRTFQRVFPRAGLKLRHSQGFHPHPLLSFVLPLPVGQSSCCELLDFELVEDMPADSIPALLNAAFPAGLTARACFRNPRPARELALLRAGVTLVYDNGIPPGAADVLRALFAREEVIIEKRTKHKELAQINLIPLLRELNWEAQEDSLVADALVCAQNPGLNPALLGKAVERYCPEWMPDFVRVQRNELYDAAVNVFR